LPDSTEFAANSLAADVATERNSMKLGRILGFAFLLALCLQPLPAFSDGLVRDGVGPISTGRGGTNQGFADNAAIILDNPGSLVNVEGAGLFEIGADTVITSVDYSNPFNDVNSKIRPLPMPVLGYVHKSEDCRWACGIGAFAPAGFGAAYGNLNNPLLGSNEYKSIGGLAKVLPALSYRVNDRLSIGASVGVAFCHVELDGPLFVQTGPFAGLPAIVELQGTGAAPTGSVGMQYRISDSTVLGASYTEQTNFNLRGGTHATLLPGFPIVSDFDNKIHIKWPRSVAVGLKHELCPHHRVSADVIWYDWAHAFDQLGLEFSGSSNPLISTSIRDEFPMHWMNSVSTRLGYEWMPTNRDTFRGGYVYHGSPVPDSTLNPYLDGVLNHAFSLGYSRSYQRFILNAAYQYNFGKHRHVADSSIVGGDFDNSSLSAQAHFAMFSVLVPF
jgi:long-chain fatty acid transport protein